MKLSKQEIFDQAARQGLQDHAKGRDANPSFLKHSPFVPVEWVAGAVNVYNHAYYKGVHA